LLIADYHEVCTGYAFRLTGILILRILVNCMNFLGSELNAG
jgi:hypothetical protein